MTYAGQKRLGRHLYGRRRGSGIQLAVQSSVRLMAGTAAHLCRAMAVFPCGGSIGFVVIVIFSRVLGRGHGRRLEEGGPRSGGGREGFWLGAAASSRGYGSDGMGYGVEQNAGHERIECHISWEKVLCAGLRGSEEEKRASDLERTWRGPGPGPCRHSTSSST